MDQVMFKHLRECSKKKVSVFSSHLFESRKHIKNLEYKLKTLWDVPGLVNRIKC